MNQPVRPLTLSSLFAALLAMSAFIRIPAGPVPLTLQAPMVLLAGYCLGPRHGVYATLLYTAVGLMGLPVFASGGGPAYVLSPTFGYIIGFSFCAFLIGMLARLNRSGSALTAYLLMVIALAGIYIPGLLWLALSMHWIAAVPRTVTALLQAGLLLPLAGNLLTAIPAALIAVRLQKRMRPRTE